MEKIVKITKKDKFAMLLEIAEVANNPMLVEFINHEVELLDKKSASRSNRPTKNQVENEALMEVLLSTLVTLDKPSTVTEIVKASGLQDITNQKGSALMKKLLETEKVDKKIEKGKSLFFTV